MTDPLGQSQVIPYLQGLSKKGYQFYLLSCEKPEAFEKNKTSFLKNFPCIDKKKILIFYQKFKMIYRF